VRFPKIQKWVIEKQKNRNVQSLISAVRALGKNFSDQYFLLNLGFNCLPPKLPMITFDKGEVEQAEKFMNELGLKKQRYVCFCVRDESYYKDFKPDLFFGSTENFKFRNAKTTHYQKAAAFLKEEGITPILMGFSTKSAPKIFLRPALCPKFRPWIEAYLFRECLFSVGMMTGATLYASLFQRPVLWSDVFWRGAPVGTREDLILPKKVLKRTPSISKKGKATWAMLHMKDWVQLGPPPDNDWSSFSERGYESQNCSPDEILNAVKDMLKFVKTGKKFPSSVDRHLHREFSKLHLIESKKLGQPPTRLAPSWARANRNLIENSSYDYYWLGPKMKSQMDFKTIIHARETKNILMSKRPGQPFVVGSPLNALKTVANLVADLRFK